MGWACCKYGKDEKQKQTSVGKPDGTTPLGISRRGSE